MKLFEFDEEKKEALADYWDREQIIKTVIWFIAFLGLTVFIISVLSTINKSNNYETEISNMNAQITQLEVSIEELSNVETPTDNSYSALDSGVSVANIQNDYQSIEISVLNGTANTNENGDSMSTNDDALSAYVGDGSGIYDWYFCPNIYYKWEFKTTSSFYKDEVPVIWVCYQNSSTTILAYTIATYDAKLGKFNDIYSYVTSQGQELIDLNLIDNDNTATSSDAESNTSEETVDADNTAETTTETTVEDNQ
jgi:hypothetical protein